MELKLILIGFACATAGLMALATYLKWKEVRAAGRWLPVRGKVISSRVEAREVRVSPQTVMSFVSGMSALA